MIVTNRIRYFPKADSEVDRIKGNNTMHLKKTVPLFQLFWMKIRVLCILIKQPFCMSTIMLSWGISSKVKVTAHFIIKFLYCAHAHVLHYKGGYYWIFQIRIESFYAGNEEECPLRQLEQRWAMWGGELPLIISHINMDVKNHPLPKLRKFPGPSLPNNCPLLVGQTIVFAPIWTILNGDIDFLMIVFSDQDK